MEAVVESTNNSTSTENRLKLPFNLTYARSYGTTRDELEFLSLRMPENAETAVVSISGFPESHTAGVKRACFNFGPR